MQRKPQLYEALFSVIALIFTMGVGLAKYHTAPHVPMLLGSLFASIIAYRLGYKWKDIEKGMIGCLEV